MRLRGALYAPQILPGLAIGGCIIGIFTSENRFYDGATGYVNNGGYWGEAEGFIRVSYTFFWIFCRSIRSDPVIAHFFAVFFKFFYIPEKYSSVAEDQVRAPAPAETAVQQIS